LCTPRANPDFAGFARYMRGTTGWDSRGSPRLPSASSVAAPASSGSSGAVNVRRAQELLNALAARRGDSRLNVGAADGIAGRRTAAAVQIFQQTARLPVTGRIDAATYAALLQA